MRANLCGRWGLPEDFLNWLEEENVFCDTLVDRIITGYPEGGCGAPESGKRCGGPPLDTGEPFRVLGRSRVRMDEAGASFEQADCRW